MVDYDYVKWCETAMNTAESFKPKSKSQYSYKLRMRSKDANYKPDEIKR